MAHATVASLMRTIESFLISNSPMESLNCGHREEFCALHEKVSSLEVFLKNFEKNNVSEEMTDLEAQIKEVANVVERIIQFRVTEVVTENDESLRGKANEKLSDSLQQVAGDIDRVWKESTKIQDKGKQVSKEPLVQDFSSSTKYIPRVKNYMVGRDDQRERLLDLTRDYSGEPKVIPIVGMGGIGKTTLAREVYNDVSILSHFDARAWATVSQKHNVKGILLSLLHSMIEIDDTIKMKSEAELRDMLQKSLKGKRYLIVMDDIWSSEVWDDVRLCFPSENNAGSRILLTTRNNEVACYAGTENLSLHLDFMDQDESWNLFKSAAFANEALPSEFETIGKQIADKCHGLPLTIVVVAGLLKSKTTIEDWESVAKDIKSFVANDPDEQCSHVLRLSYNHLTSNLKACLLYFGIFPEDTEIPVTKLMGLWMAEGFLNLEKDLEGEAEKCLQDLIDRCLVLISKKSLDETKIRSCKVHDLIYDLCLREVQRGNVFMVNDIVFENSDAIKSDAINSDAIKSDAIKSDAIKSDAVERSDVKSSCFLYFRILFGCKPNHVPSRSQSSSRTPPFKCWTGDEIANTPPFKCLIGDEIANTPPFKCLTGDEIAYTPPFKCLTGDEIANFPYGLYRTLQFPGHQQLTEDDNSSLLKLTRSIFFSGYRLSTFILESELIHFKLLRVLDLSDISSDTFPLQILSLIWLRYLSLSCGYIGVPPEICRLWNLQTLIVRGSDPLNITLPEQIWGLTQLRHLKIESFCLPNRPSEFADEWRHMSLSNLQTISYLSIPCCTKEVISGIRNVKKIILYGYTDVCESYQEPRLFDNLIHLHQLESLTVWSFIIPSAFPATLKRLKLAGTCLRWSYLDIIAELPNLEVLKLICNASLGTEWHPIVGGFTRLKLLLIQQNELEYWNATNDNFPVLERLFIRDCPNLKEIPVEFADIYSLQLIELKDCTPELMASVARIQQEQADLGNDPVVVVS